MGDGDDGEVGSLCKVSRTDDHPVIALEAGMRVQVIGFEAGQGDRHCGDDGHRPLVCRFRNSTEEDGPQPWMVPGSVAATR